MDDNSGEVLLIILAGSLVLAILTTGKITKDEIVYQWIEGNALIGKEIYVIDSVVKSFNKHM